jgi:hypothetical protein
MQRSAEFVVACSNAAELLELIEEAFDVVDLSGPVGFAQLDAHSSTANQRRAEAGERRKPAPRASDHRAPKKERSCLWLFIHLRRKWAAGRSSA